VTIPGCPINYSETKIAPLRPAPLLGEHTEEIVTRVLKYPKEKYDELQKKGVF
jgi:crotonobetainyl-CoA:carnitine CoA-transferase CaiB-like acyl-CoA transferase